MIQAVHFLLNTEMPNIDPVAALKLQPELLSGESIYADIADAGGVERPILDLREKSRSAFVQNS